MQRSALTCHRDLSNKEFNSNDTRGPKSVSAFIIKLSELAPRLVIKQMTLLVKQLDSEVGPWFLGCNQTHLIRLGLYSSMCSHRSVREFNRRSKQARRTQREFQDSDQWLL